MRIAVVGSRGFGPIIEVSRRLDFIRSKTADMEIVSGGADGVDKKAEEWANASGIKTAIFPANWEEFGDAAGPKRNATIVENSDCMIAFWDGESPGTLDAICRGQKRKDYPVVVYLG